MSLRIILGYLVFALITNIYRASNCLANLSEETINIVKEGINQVNTQFPDTIKIQNHEDLVKFTKVAIIAGSTWQSLFWPKFFIREIKWSLFVLKWKIKMRLIIMKTRRKTVKSKEVDKILFGDTKET